MLSMQPNNDKYPKYDIDESLGTIVHWTERALINTLNRNFRRAGYDITTEQWRLLVNLWNREGQNQQELAAATRKDKTSITRIIHGLERRDLIIRIHDKGDNRNKILYLTGKGKKTVKDLIGLAKETLTEAKSGISHEELETCGKVLRQITRNLKRP